MFVTNFSENMYYKHAEHNRWFMSYSNQNDKFLHIGDVRWKDAIIKKKPKR